MARFRGPAAARRWRCWLRVAVYPILGDYAPPHNTALAVLVEQGIVGFLVFLALLGACVASIWKLARPERKFWVVLMLSWLVGVMSVHWQYHKLTWLLFGLLGSHASHQSVRLKEERQAGISVDAALSAAAVGA